MSKLQKILIVIAAVVLLASGGYLLADFFEGKKNEGELRQLANIVASETTLSAEAIALPDTGVQVELVNRIRVSDDDYEKLVAMATAVQLFVYEDAGFQDRGIGAIKLKLVDWRLLPDGTDAPSPTPTPKPDPAAPPKPAPERTKAPALGKVELGPFAEVLIRGKGSMPTVSRQAMDRLSQFIAQYVKTHDTPLNPDKLRVICELSRGRQRLILPQYMKLYEQNKDLIGWIEIEGTVINYPVMYTPRDPEFYLRANFEQDYAYSGVPFLEARCDPSEPSANLIVYAHNMKSGTMFGSLSSYKDQAYWEKHKTIRFDLLAEEGEYEIFAMFESRQYQAEEEGFKYYEYIDFETEAKFAEFCESAEAASFVDTGVKPRWGDQILTLSTCSSHTDEGTFVVVARRIN